ncbi:Nicotinamidase-related amidase [Marinactinospora thermotolerans DSM 45154]|uniref:Nicotinamidase-related amidase n=1 Tax=Marinactinospora thermotolerans DSM 45154 TaxID=1122192 RepID=A0A1T4P9D8_9ACTN|nr:Nicotinamidase-related amidase [Marinactinospora thermotolerans DSM 45154]
MTALVVIDMQNGFVTSASRHVVPVVADLVGRWRRAGGATVFVRYSNPEGSPHERLLNWSRLRRAPETDIVDELVPYLDEACAVIDKTVYSAFADGGARIFARGGWSDLVFCGIATENCVLKSAVDAFEHGYGPWIVRDATASHRGAEAHRAGLLVASMFIGAHRLVDAVDLPV